MYMRIRESKKRVAREGKVYFGMYTRIKEGWGQMQEGWTRGQGRQHFSVCQKQSQKATELNTTRPAVSASWQ